MRVPPPGYVQGQPTHSPAPQASRGPGPMIRQQGPHPQMSAAQMQQQHQVALQERELAKRRARKPTDKTIPEGVEEIVPNARMYRELREMERRYDAAIMRKRLDIQDSVNRNVKVCLSPPPPEVELLMVKTEHEDDAHLYLQHRERPAMANAQASPRRERVRF
jgi:hypothetical protein